MYGFSYKVFFAYSIYVCSGLACFRLAGIDFVALGLVLSIVNACVMTIRKSVLDKYLLDVDQVQYRHILSRFSLGADLIMF